VSTLLIPDAQIAQQDRAGLKAELAKKAEEAINQAGSGLVAADEQCRLNSANGHTLAVLVCVQGYINDAMMALIERENLGIEGV
jgi:hypothetical protein